MNASERERHFDDEVVACPGRRVAEAQEPRIGDAVA